MDDCLAIEASESQLSAKVAEAPFNKPSADLILRSADFTNFHVKRAILSEASDVFEDMLTIPQPFGDALGGSRDGKPIVNLTEDAATLRIVLQLCYPLPTPTILPSNVWQVLEASVKYNMEGPKEFIVNAMEGLAAEEPLRIYALACIYNIPDLARHSARLTLDHEVSMILQACIPELERLTAIQILRLARYHYACSQAIADIFQTRFDWLGRQTGWIWYMCDNAECEVLLEWNKYYAVRRKGGNFRRPKQWWACYVERLSVVLSGRPTKAAIADCRVDAKAALQRANKCGQCRGEASEKLQQFQELLAEEIDAKISKIVLEL